MKVFFNDRQFPNAIFIVLMYRKCLQFSVIVKSLDIDVVFF